MASNGHPYYSIGRVLLDEGRLPRDAMSLQGLRRYFRDHPEETTRVLYRNPRYIFFRPVEQGPQGNLGLILVPGRSIAADQRLFPPGGLAFVQIQQPVLNAQGEITAWRPASRLCSTTILVVPLRALGESICSGAVVHKLRWLLGTCSIRGSYFFCSNAHRDA